MSSGAHVIVTLNGEARNWRDAYSLVSPPGARDTWEIIVCRVADPRGGPAFLHDTAREGNAMTFDPPVNLFPIPTRARRHLLLAGGIGVTPFLAYLPALRAEKIPFDLHLICCAEDAPAFRDLLCPNCNIHPARDRIDISALLARQPLGTHVSVCGRPNFMDAVVEAARAAGYPLGKIHIERFGGSSGGAPFHVELARSHRTIAVGADESLLEALEAAGIDGS